MAAVDQTRYDDLCRLCAAKTTLVLGINIFENEGTMRELNKKIENCLPLQIHEADELPKMICETCVYKIESFYDFRERCVRTERLLIDLLKEIQHELHQNQQESISVVPLHQTDLIMVQHDNQLLNVHNIENVTELNLSQLIKHEIILSQQNVDIHGHSLHNITLTHHELANQDLSNHSLQAQEPILVEANNSHSLQGNHFSDDNLVLINHQHQLLSGHFRLQPDLHVNLPEAGSVVNEITLSDDCREIKENNETYSMGERTDSVKPHSYEFSNDNNIEENSLNPNLEVTPVQTAEPSPGKSTKLDMKSLSNENTEEHLLIIDEQIQSDINKQMLIVHGSNPNNSNVSQKKLYYCNICGQTYEKKEEFNEHCMCHLYKCSICYTMFTSSDMLDSHRKEVHGGECPVVMNDADQSLETYHQKDSNNLIDHGYEYQNSSNSDENSSSVKPEKIQDSIKFEKAEIGTVNTEASSSDALLSMNKQVNGKLSKQTLTVQQTTKDVDDSAKQTDNSKWFYCNLCGKTYQDKNQFNRHYQTHFFKCSICFAVFTNSDVLNTHRKETHGIDSNAKIDTQNTIKLESNNNAKYSSDSDGEPANCDNSKDYDTEEEQNNGESQTVEEKKSTLSPKVCKECGKSYKTNYKLAEHMRKHTGEKPYKCSSCDKGFRSKIGLAQHEAKHTGQYDYSCTTCGKGFQCKSYLMVHQRVHSDLKPYPCTTCGRNFKTKQSLLDHTNRHLGVKPYMCDVCGRGFITKGLCKAHQKIHSGQDNRKYSCKICNKMFVSKSYLQTHLRIHTGEKPYICEVCGKGFLTRVDLRIHSTMHTGEKSYVCEICGKAFARRDALRCHRRSHTGERPYSCDLCGQTFTQFTPMAIHKRLHTGERPYTCETCGKTFISRSTMVTHAKKHTR